MFDTVASQVIMMKVLIRIIKKFPNYKLNLCQKMFILLHFKSRIINIFRSCALIYVP